MVSKPPKPLPDIFQITILYIVKIEIFRFLPSRRSPGTTTDQGHLAICFARTSEKGRKGPKRPPEQPQSTPQPLKTLPRLKKMVIYDSNIHRGRNFFLKFRRFAAEKNRYFGKTLNLREWGLYIDFIWIFRFFPKIERYIKSRVL